MGNGVVVFADGVVDAFFEGVEVLLVNFFVGVFVSNVYTVDFVLADVVFSQETLFEVALVPCGEDEGMVNLAELGEVGAFVDFLFDFGEDDIAND